MLKIEDETVLKNSIQHIIDSGINEIRVYDMINQFIEKRFKYRNTEKPTQYILCSAIWYKELPKMVHLPKNCDKSVVLCDWRHPNIISQLATISELRTAKYGINTVGENIQGFLTNDNMFVDRYVDRYVATVIAFNAGQIKEMVNMLYSKDVW